MKKYLAALAMVAGIAMAKADLKHTFVCVENGKKPNLVYVDQFEPSNSWKTSLPKGSRDICLVGTDKVLVSTSKGASLRSLKDGAELVSFKGPKGNQTVSVTPDGKVLMAGATEFIWANLDGKVIKKAPIQKLNGTRLARQLKSGNVVIAANSYELHEYDQTGKQLWNKKFKEKTYLALESDNGTFISTTGHGVELVSVDREGNETLVAGGKTKHPDALFAWFSGFDQAENENFIIVNWCGHGWKKEKIHLFEFDKDNNIVWQWKDDSVSQVTTVQVIK